MKTIIYVDILFAINFIMDGLCLALTAVFNGEKLVFWRFLFAAALGGLYSIVVIAAEDLHPLCSVSLHFLAAFVICAVGTKWKSARKAFSKTACFFFVNAVLGGVLYAVYSLCGYFFTYNGAFYAEVSPSSLIIGGVVAGTVLLFYISKRKAKLSVRHCELKVLFRGQEGVFDCVIDSGNMLTCPYTALPVAIISGMVAKKLFSAEELSSLSVMPAMEKVRPLPAKGIGGVAMMPSFIPEHAEIRPFGNKSFEEKGLCVAIMPNTKDFGGSDGIIPASLL